MNDESFLKIEQPIKRSNSMFLHPSPDIDIKVIKQIGDYSLGTELGSGAFGKVVLGKHILTNELVAIKILDKMILSHTPDDYQSVKQEINILKSVKHKHIVQLYDVLQTSRHIFIIMEYCEGKDLLDYILTKSKLSEEESLKYFQQLINALFYLHSQNIAHRDIKIDNMLLDRNRDLKLVDFGLSTKYPDDNLLDQPCGTVVYAAPEVLQGKEYHGMLADVWSSGIVLYGMLSGYLPFGEQDDEVNRKNIIMGKIKFPSYFSDCVIDLLMHMLDLDPMTRYTLQEVRNHPWFNLIGYKLIPGIIIGYNIIPVDEKIINLCVTYNCDKEKVRESVINNKYNSESALYYLLIKKLQKKGFHSVSDFCSDEFINFVLDDNNLIDSKDERDTNKKIQESEIKYNININANKMCTAPHDGKLKKEEKYEKKEKNENHNLITPKNSESQNINKRINFDETPKGVLSFIINTPSFEETNNNIFNIGIYNSINNKKTYSNNNYDNESKKTNKNTSSDSKPKNVVLQVVNVNDFQISGKKNKEISDKKIINQDEFNNKLNTNNIFLDANIQTEVENDKDNKILNVFYHYNDNNEKVVIERENEQEKDLISKSINDLHINDSNHLNISNNNNIIDNSIEIIYDKSSPSNELKIRNNADLLETPFITSKKLDITFKNTNENLNLKTLEKDKDINKERQILNKEFIIETPTNNKEYKKDNIDDNNHISRNTLSKQKNYIDRSKTYSNKNKNEDKNKLDINKIKEIRKINLFQEEIKEENIFRNDDDKCILSSITEKEINDNINININQNDSKKDFNSNINSNMNYNQFTPIKKKEMFEYNSLINESNSLNNNNIENDNDIKMLKVNLINENQNVNNLNVNNIHSEKYYNENNKYNNNKDEYNNNHEVNTINIKNDDNSKNNNKENINDKSNNIENNKNENINNEKHINGINDSIDNNKNNNNNENILKENNNKENINNENIKNEYNENIQKIKNDDIYNAKLNNENINKEKINNENNNSENYKQNNIININNNVKNNCNIQQVKEEENQLNDKNIKTTVEEFVTKPKKSKIAKKKEKKNKTKNDKKKNLKMNSIIKNDKGITNVNKSIQMRSKKSISKEKNNNYSSKTKLEKKNEKEIVSIKVMINKNLLSKEKKKEKDIVLNYRTEQQRNKIKSIYKVNIQPTTLSKSKFTTINKKPTSSIFKKKLINTCYTNQKRIKNNKILSGNINGSHVKSSSIHILKTMVKKDKSIKKNIVNNNYNSLYKINNILKTKNKKIISSTNTSKSKRPLHNYFLNKSYNNKYMKLFKSTQYKNNNLLFTNKIDKTNLNKKFDEIAHRINKNTKNNKNIIQNKKIPLWKYIQSDQYTNQNNSLNINNKSSSPQIRNDSTKNQKVNKKIRDKMILQNSYENKVNGNAGINKLNNINKKSTSLSKDKNDKNINVFFINIKNYINKNENGIKRPNKNFIESSASNYRYRSPYETRELSENEKNKYLNQKTRYTKIPWKIKKKALDEKKEIGDIYKFYMNKNNNPFKRNNKKINKQLNNIKPISNRGNNKIYQNQVYCLNSLRGMNYKNLPINNKINNLKEYKNALLANMKNEYNYKINKKYNQSYTPQYVNKKSYFSTFKNINQRNLFLNKLCQSTNNNTESKNNNNNFFYKNYSHIFDLSCLFINEENVNDCYHNLIYKLIKNQICFVQKSNKIIKCFKNGLCYEIEIEKIDEYKNANKNKKNIYCFKICGKNGFPINKIFRNLVLE